MYHHGMGGPPQRPLQVRNVCLIIVDRRTKILISDLDGAVQKQTEQMGKYVEVEKHKNMSQPDAKRN